MYNDMLAQGQRAPQAVPGMTEGTDRNLLPLTSAVPLWVHGNLGEPLRLRSKFKCPEQDAAANWVASTAVESAKNGKCRRCGCSIMHAEAIRQPLT